MADARSAVSLLRRRMNAAITLRTLSPATQAIPSILMPLPGSAGISTAHRTGWGLRMSGIVGHFVAGAQPDGLRRAGFFMA